MAAQAGVQQVRAREPWIDVGGSVSESDSPEEMLIKSGLDWTVSKRRSYISSRREDPTSTDQPSELKTVDDYYFLVRDDTNQVFGPAGRDYVVTQNLRAFSFYKKFTEAGHMRMHSAGSFKGGRHPWALAEINKEITLAGNDTIKPYVLLSSPHIWGKALVFKFTTIAPVCYNTFMKALHDVGQTFRLTHVREFDDVAVAEAQKIFLTTLDQFDDFGESAKLLAGVTITDQVATRYIADVLQQEEIKAIFGKDFYKKAPTIQAETLMGSSLEVDFTKFKRSAYDAHESIKKQPGAQLQSRAGTLWGAFNAVTYWADHISGRDRGNALYSAWFGDNANVKARAFERAQQMARAA